MSELLEDPTYRKFLTTKPEMPPHLRDPKKVPTAPWVVYVQREQNGPWGKKSFWKYGKALKFMSDCVYKYKVWDCALNNKRIGYEPPNRLVRVKGKFVVGTDGKRRQKVKYVVWRPSTALLLDQPEHLWCKYCRRPTLFKYYSRHKVLGTVTTDVRRCNICGASERIAMSRFDIRHY